MKGVLALLLLVLGLPTLAWADGPTDQAAVSGRAVAQLRQAPTLPAKVPLPMKPRRAMVIVVEENQAQTYSVSWGGLSDALRQIDPATLLPEALRQPIQKVANVVDPLLRVLNIPQAPNLLEVVRIDIRRQLARMLGDWLVAAGNRVGIPGTGCARDILTTVASEGIQLGKDPFAVFKDRYGEAGLGNCLRQMAAPYYQRVDLLSDQSATFASFSALLRQLDSEGYEVDLLLDIHGCSSTSSLNNKIVCQEPLLVFAPVAGNPGSAWVRPSQITGIKAGASLRLRNVYMIPCWGADFNTSWRTSGAKESNGARELNYYVLLSPIAFVDAYTRGGRTLREAAEIAYSAERMLLNGGSYPVTIDLKAFLDQRFPHQPTGLLPCAGFDFFGNHIGASLRTDYEGQKDYCVAEAFGQTFKGEPGCPPFYTKEIRAGTDRCWPPDLIGAACPGGTREGCRFRFDLGLAYGPVVDRLLSLRYGQNTNAPVNNQASSTRIHDPRP